MSWSYNPKFAVTNLVWANPRSLATTNGITFVFFSSGYLDVSVPRVCLSCDILYLQYSGLPHSDICGSICVCQSTQLFAAYHVLLRLWEPRHSPYALILLIVLFALLMSYSNFAHYIIVCTLLLFSYSLFPICQWTVRIPVFPGPDNGQLMGTTVVVLGGEYRSRTDDLLRARQAL